MPPDLYGGVIERIAAAGLAPKENGGEPRARVVIEKPFGTDLQTARELNQRIHEALGENQIYRIDHYLGKETVQNIMVFRFANAIFEPIWNRRYVDHVQITAAESVGVENRGGYYESSRRGARHVSEPLAPAALSDRDGAAGGIQRRRGARREGQAAARGSADRAGRSRRPRRCAASTAPAQIDGKAVVGYREEPGVAKDSTTVTYAAIRLFIDNWRWEGVPFYLRSGKRMAKRVTEIAIQFKRPPMLLFKSSRRRRRQPQRVGDAHSARRRRVAALRGQTAGTRTWSISPLSLDFQLRGILSATARRRRTKPCWKIASRAIRHCLRATIGWNWPGRWWIRLFKSGI